MNSHLGISQEKRDKEHRDDISIFFQCLEAFCGGPREDLEKAQNVLLNQINHWFSSALVTSCQSGERNSSSLEVSGIARVKGVVIKKRPIRAALLARQQVFLFFDVVEDFLSLFCKEQQDGTSRNEKQKQQEIERSAHLVRMFGASKVLESTFWLVGVMGNQIGKILDKTASCSSDSICVVVVDTYETYLSKVVLVGSGVHGGTLSLVENQRHTSLLPWWMFLGATSGLFCVYNERHWCRRMTQNIFFILTDCLLRQSIFLGKHTRESLIGYAQGLQSLKRDVVNPLPKVLSLDQQSSRSEADVLGFQEGLSANIGAEAVVNDVFRNIHALSQRRNILGFDATDRSSKSPSPCTIPQFPMKSPRYISPSASHFVGPAPNRATFNARKMKKLALQFSVKLGNLYATQDVHAMLSFLPVKVSELPSGSTDGLVELITDEEKEEGFESSNEASFGPKESVDSFNSTPYGADEILLERIGTLIRNCSSPFHVPLLPLQCQQLSLFIALWLFARVARRSAPNFGRSKCSSSHNQEVTFGVQFGYEQNDWLSVAANFLDICTIGGIIASTEHQQTQLAVQLAEVMSSFARHCYWERLASTGDRKIELNFLSRRWVPKCQMFTQEILRFRNSSLESPIRGQLLQHFYFLTYFFRCILGKNENSRYKPKKSNNDVPDSSDSDKPLPSPRPQLQSDRFSFLSDILGEGEALLQAIQTCMHFFTWRTVVQGTLAKDSASDEAKGTASRPILRSSGGDQAYSCPSQFLGSKEDHEFIKFCMLYYLYFLDALIEIALITSSRPSYLTATLLRQDTHATYLTQPGSEIMQKVPGAEDSDWLNWQHYFHYQCFSVMKNGTDYVDMQFISTLNHWKSTLSDPTLWVYSLDSLHLDYLLDSTPSPDMPFNDSFFFLRILNHAKNVSRYVCSSGGNNCATHVGPSNKKVVNPSRPEASLFVAGVTPFVSTSSGTFIQRLSVPHQHPFVALEKQSQHGKSDQELKMSLEKLCRDSWLRAQALQLLSISAGPVAVPVPVPYKAKECSDDERVYILNGSASKTYVRLLFLRIFQSVFSPQGNYSVKQERYFLHSFSKGCRYLYDLAKRLWTSCLTLSLQTIQCMSHYHAKAKDTAMHLGVHEILSRLLDALTFHHKNKICMSVSQCMNSFSHSEPVHTDMGETLEEAVALDDASVVSVEESNSEVVSVQGKQTPSFVIPQLNLDGVGPALYFLSSGDTGAALQANLFPEMPVVSSPCHMRQVSNEKQTTDDQNTKEILFESQPNLSIPLEIPSNGAKKDTSDVNKVESVILYPQYLYADEYLVTCAVCCTCSLLVQQSGMIRYESTVSNALLRKRMCLPEASYQLLYGGDLTWKKHIEDTRSSAVLKKYLGSCYSEHKTARPSFVFQSLRQYISSSAGLPFCSVLEKWLDHHRLTYFRSSVQQGEKEVALNSSGNMKNLMFESLSTVPDDINNDESLHSFGLFVLLRLLIPRYKWNQQFEFLHRLGAGGFGTVMAANFQPLSTDSETSPLSTTKWSQEERKALEANPCIAIKSMPFLQHHDADCGTLPTCHGEVLSMMCLWGHPYIVPLLSFGCSEDGYFIVLPRYDCGSLCDWRSRQYPSGCAALVQSSTKTPVNRKGRHPENSLFALCCPLITQLFEAIAFLHSHQLRHNDIKADNLLIDCVDRATSVIGAEIQPEFQESTEIVLPRSIRLCDFGSCESCSNEDMQELLRDLLAGESKFVEGRWGFGKGTEAIQPPEIIAPRWRYELLRAVTLHFAAEHQAPPNTPLSKLPTSFASSRKQHNDEPDDITELLERLRRIELSADIWGCGCLIYELLTGIMLFGEAKLGRLTALATSAREKLVRILKSSTTNLADFSPGQHSLSVDQWDISDLREAVGNDVVDFLLELLSINPLQRPTASDALQKWKCIVQTVL